MMLQAAHVDQSCTDALDPALPRLIKWTQEHLTGGKTELQKVLESCTSVLVKLDKYSNDIRFLRIFIQYVGADLDALDPPACMSTCRHTPIGPPPPCRPTAFPIPMMCSSSSRCVGSLTSLACSPSVHFVLVGLAMFAGAVHNVCRYKKP